MADDNRGFPSMDEDEQRDIANQGGQASGGQFEEGSQRTGEAGKKGAEEQPTEAKRKGGKHSSSS